MTYISREAALYVHCAEADRGGCVDLPENGGYCRLGNRCCEEGKLFDNVPAADVRPVVYGRWIVLEDLYGERALCSACGFGICVNEPGNGLPMVEHLNYCPNCGADMRKVAEGEQVKEGRGMTKLKCKFEQDEVCVNADCPLCADFCPVIYVPGVCRFEERWRKQNESTD